MFASDRASLGKNVGSISSILGIGAGLFLLLGPTGQYETTASDGTRVTGTTSGIDYLIGTGPADPALFFWALVVLGLVLVGGYGAWNGSRYVVWTVGFGLVTLSILGLLSIGLFVMPAVIAFIVSINLFKFIDIFRLT